MIRRITTADYSEVIELIGNCRNFDNFYVTRDNVRTPLKEFDLVKKVLIDCTKFSDLAWGSFKNNELVAMVVIIGRKEKRRPYIKILSIENKFKVLNDLIRFLFWNYGGETFAKIKKQDKLIIEILQRNKFRFQASRGEELLLFKRDKQIIRMNKENKVEYSKNEKI